MRIEAQEHRLYWKIVGVGILVDLIGAALIMLILQRIEGSHDDDFFQGAGIIWLAIQVFRFVILLLNLARLWLANELGAFKSAGEAFYTALKVGKLPKPSLYTLSVDSYLTDVADDETQPGRARATAAMMYGVRQGTKGMGIVHSVFLDSAHEKALERYEAESDRPISNDE